MSKTSELTKLSAEEIRQVASFDATMTIVDKTVDDLMYEWSNKVRSIFAFHSIPHGSSITPYGGSIAFETVEIEDVIVLQGKNIITGEYVELPENIVNLFKD